MGTSHALNARVGTANRIVDVTPSFRVTVVGTIHNTRVKLSALGGGTISGLSLPRTLSGRSSLELFAIFHTLGYKVSISRVRHVAVVSR